ncbi:hypothetical protein GLX30_19605 [Streptomyces sp. Tu 2975]|uniref:hypothetical protein n=1 Tax=Streptomyces sp. Tu 2975 TaxID=2676871 RepID=UPI0013588BBF|nr:hypothetical protein [Streptomyces sp. Tu 2975]QIP85870.1 hypothetical protein GLX30_19605 [Streptomyces sp. Tu 2975]
MGLMGFLVLSFPGSPGGRGRHRKAKPSGRTERLTRLLGTLAVTAAAAFGPAVPAVAVPTGPAAPGTPPGELPAHRTAPDAAQQRTDGRSEDTPPAASDARGPEGAAGGAAGLPGSEPVRHVEMARTGGTAEQLWLLGGVALSLTAAGIVAVAATRGRRRDH